MSTVVDFHSHILPGVDDGSISLECSIGMLQMEAMQGVERVVATPHFYAHYDSPEAFLTRRAEAEAVLRTELLNHPELPKLDVGAEVHYFNGISDADILPQLTIGNSRYVMIEMPMSHWTERMYRELAGIWNKQGLIPIVAHIDRYIAPFRTHHILERLEELPVLVQANASFFNDCGTRRMALRMLRKGRVHLLGSDCHNLSDRVPNLESAVVLIQKYLGEDALSLIHSCEAAVLSEE